MTDARAEDSDHYQMAKLIRQAALAKSRIEELSLTASMEFERIRHWLEQSTESDRRIIAGVEAQAAVYMANRLRTQPRGAKKSVDFPDGRIESRMQPIQFERNDDQLLAWAKERGLTRSAPAPDPVLDWQRIKQECRPDDGQLVRQSSDGHDEVVAGVEVKYPAPAVSLTIYTEGLDSVRSQVPESQNLTGLSEGFAGADANQGDSGLVPDGGTVGESAPRGHCASGDGSEASS